MGEDRTLRVLWLGPWHSDHALNQRKAVNQAATRWSRSCLFSLSQYCSEIAVCTHCREQYWPGGELFPKYKATDFEQSFPLQVIDYVNFPGLRDFSLGKRYIQAVQRLLKKRQFDLVITYNLFPYHCACSPLFEAAGVRWVPLVLDQVDPLPDKWESFQALTQRAAGIVFLSKWAKENYPGGKPVFHLDGGISLWHGSENDKKEVAKTIVYSGKYDDSYGGLDLLFEILRHVRHRDYKMLLTGKDAKNCLDKYLRHNSQVEYLGFLPDEELHKVYTNASVFINPRPPDVSWNRMIFPSKLHDYLAYGKPIVSSWTAGLAEEYRDLLLVPEQNIAAAYAALIDEALDWDREKRNAHARKIEEWAKAHTWERQMARFMEWGKELAP